MQPFYDTSSIKALSDEQPQLQERQPVVLPELFGLGHRRLDLGDVAAGVIEHWLVPSGQFERHADSVIRARRGNATVIAD
jgi:hypothetical protein